MLTLLNKVWYDLWKDKSRTVQVVLVIALGAIAIGLVIGGRNLISESVLTGSQRAEPAHIRLSVSPPLTKAQLERVGRIEGVAEYEGLQSAGIEWRFPGDEAWQTGVLNGREDYTEQTMNVIGLLEGQWPARSTVGIGTKSVGSDEIFQGDTIEIRYGDRTRIVDVVASMDPVGPTPVFQNQLYADGRTFERLTGIETYNVIQTRDVTFDQARAEATDLAMQDYFEDINVDSVGLSFPFQERVVSPDVSPAEAILNALFLLLGLLGVIVVILGIFLVYNSISAIVTQQISQIGTMKAIGATSSQVIWAYLVLVVSYGLLATVISIPVGGAAALGLQSFFADFLNQEIFDVRFDTTAIMIQVVICLIVPFLAALFPLIGGMRTTVREAISSYGLNGSASALDRLVARAVRIPYTILLTIGNTFRNRRRVLIIEIALITAGAIFMMVIGVNDATNYTFGSKLAKIHNYQVTLSFAEAQRTEAVQMAANRLEGIGAVESWLVLPGSARLASQQEASVSDARITLFGQPVDTDHYRPEMETGRWLAASDSNAVVVSQQIANQQEWVVGDVITLEDNNGRTLDAEIVGTLFDPATNTSMHLPLSTLQHDLRYFNETNTIWVQTTNSAAEFQTAVAENLETVLELDGVTVNPGSTFGEKTIAGITSQAGDGYAIILNLLAVMAIVIALVGGVGLSGILSLSVLERRREIGVMRAIGASSWQVIRLFVGEGMLLGLISWVIALPLSIPVAYFFTTQGLSLALNQQLVYTFTPNGAVLWLVIISILAIVASALPARGASKISVRESLAYS